MTPPSKAESAPNTLLCYSGLRSSHITAKVEQSIFYQVHYNTRGSLSAVVTAALPVVTEQHWTNLKKRKS